MVRGLNLIISPFITRTKPRRKRISGTGDFPINKEDINKKPPKSKNGPYNFDCPVQNCFVTYFNSSFDVPPYHVYHSKNWNNCPI